jgi:hypothetical protein
MSNPNELTPAEKSYIVKFLDQEINQFRRAIVATRSILHARMFEASIDKLKKSKSKLL